jgi:hypothetical protein
LWEDQSRNNYPIIRFLWHGDPKAARLQRAGLVLFGLVCLMCSTIAVLSWLDNEQDNRTYLSFVFALVMLLIAGRLFWNALIKPKLQSKEDTDKST